MKIRLFLTLILSLFVMTACMNPQEMEEAWDACHAATGTPSVRKVVGFVYGVGTFDQGDLGPAKDLYSNETNDLSKASAVLCEEVVSSLKETCSYQSGFVLRYHNTVAHLTLISWPLKEIIAQTSIIGGFGENEVFCPPTYTHVGDEKVEDEYATIFINDWLNQFVTAPEESE